MANIDPEKLKQILNNEPPIITLLKLDFTKPDDAKKITEILNANKKTRVDIEPARNRIKNVGAVEIVKALKTNKTLSSITLTTNTLMVWSLRKLLKFSKLMIRLHALTLPAQ